VKEEGRGGRETRGDRGRDAGTIVGGGGEWSGGQDASEEGREGGCRRGKLGRSRVRDGWMGSRGPPPIPHRRSKAIEAGLEGPG
jgi:hypothetical protein